MSPISGTHLRLSCFGFSLTNTIFERAKIVHFSYTLKTKASKKPLTKGFIVNWCRYPESTGTFYAVSQSLILKAFLIVLLIMLHNFTLDFKNFRTLFVHFLSQETLCFSNQIRIQFSHRQTPGEFSN